MEEERTWSCCLKMKTKMRVISALIERRFFLSLCWCFRFWFSLLVQILVCTLFLLLRLWFLKWRSPCVLLLSVFPFVPLCFFYLCVLFLWVSFLCFYSLCSSSVIFLSSRSLLSVFFSLVQLMLVHWLAVLLFVSFFILPVPPVFFSRFSFCPLPPLFSYFSLSFFFSSLVLLTVSFFFFCCVSALFFFFPSLCRLFLPSSMFSPLCTGFVVVLLLSLVHSRGFAVADEDDSVEGLFRQHCFLSSCCFLYFILCCPVPPPPFLSPHCLLSYLLFPSPCLVLFLCFYSQNCMHFFFYIKDVR